MSSLIDLFLAHAWIITVSLITLFALVFLAWSRYTKSLLGKDFWVAVPIVGRMAKWSKMTEGTGDCAARASEDSTYVERTLVVPAERALYDYYNDGLEKIGRDGFHNAREYLKISGQNGRKPMASVLWLILGLLTVAEAFGTGLLLAPLLSQDITPALAMIAGTVIALVIAVVAVVITHGAGEDLFANALLAKVRTSFKQNKGFRFSDGTKTRDFVEPIGPEDDQTKDSIFEPAARLAARIGATSMASMHPRKIRIIGAVAFIVLFAIFTTAYRHYVFSKQEDRAAAAPMPTGAASQDFRNLFSQGGSASAAPLPDAVAHAVKRSDTRARNSIAQDTSMANDAGILILALIYVFTQFLGLLTGYKYSFFNEEGVNAYHKTLGQLGYDDFERVAVRPVAQRAQMRLGQLRSKLSSANPGYGDHMQPFDFLAAYRESVAPPAAPKPKAPPAPSVPATAVPAQAVPAATPSGRAKLLETVARTINEVQDTEQRRKTAAEIIRQHGLSLEEQQALKSVMQRIKDEQGIDPDFLDSL